MCVLPSRRARSIIARFGPRSNAARDGGPPLTQPSPEPSDDNRRGANIAAVVFVVILVLGCVWLLHALTGANDALNCVASGRHDCDHADP